jgi:hypothetical protein
MNGLLWGVLWMSAATLTAQQPNQAGSQPEPKVMVAEVNQPARLHGNVYVHPLAWLSADGNWNAIQCDYDHPKECQRFGRDYLSKPHSYTIVSADGLGAQVHVEHMSLNSPEDCFSYGGEGTISGAAIRFAGVGASSEEIFRPGPPARRVPGAEADKVRNAYAAVAGDTLDSPKELRVYSIEIEGRQLFVIQRAFEDYSEKPEYKHGNSGSSYPILTIGTMKDGKFRMLIWKEKDSDEQEEIIGLVHLKNSRDFLIDGVTDPETYSYRIYGIRDGKLALVFKGGGGGC